MQSSGLLLSGPRLNIPRIAPSLFLWICEGGKRPVLLVVGGQSSCEGASGEVGLSSAEVLDLRVFFLAAFGEALPLLKDSTQEGQSDDSEETSSEKCEWKLIERSGFGDQILGASALDCPAWLVSNFLRLSLSFAFHFSLSPLLFVSLSPFLCFSCVRSVVGVGSASWEALSNTEGRRTFKAKGRMDSLG